jgi:hypothetical protein
MTTTSPDPAAGRYLLDNRRTEAGTRLDAIAELFDPVTRGHLERVGIAPGWHCWEVGAGGPTVGAWMADRVGPSGSVVATDIDLTWLAEPVPGVRTLHHDVTADPVPGGPFDLIHARLLLVHLPRRTDLAAALVAALRPGGWLVVEDADPALQPLACPDEHGPDQVLANRIRSGFRTLLSGRGVDLSFGRTLPRLLRGLGLEDVAADAFFPVGGATGAALERATVEQLRAELVDAGLASEEEIDRHLATLSAGDLDLTTAPLVSAWGRRPDPRSTPGGDR